MVFKKGSTIHNTGRTRFKKGQTAWNKEKTKEDFPQLSNSGVKKGNKPWNVGLTIETDERVKKNIDILTASNRLNPQKYWLGRNRDEITKQKIREKYNYPMSNPETLRKWFKSNKAKPNKLEIYFDNILKENFNNFFEYAGDGKVIIGRKCPDFINKDYKLLIELFGSYWHKVDEIIERTEYFNKYGYETLVVWDIELKDKEKVIQKINDFINNAFGFSFEEPQAMNKRRVEKSILKGGCFSSQA